MSQTTTVVYALCTSAGRVVVDFGQSESSMDAFIQRHEETYGTKPSAKPTKITMTRTLETLNK